MDSSPSPHVNSVHHHPHYLHIREFFIVFGGVLLCGGIVGVSMWAYLKSTRTAPPLDEKEWAVKEVGDEDE